MNKIYRTNIFGTRIDVFEVFKETESSVWLKINGIDEPEQFSKVGETFNFFNTIEEAKQHLIAKYKKEIKYYKKQIMFTQKLIKNVQEQEAVYK